MALLELRHGWQAAEKDLSGKGCSPIGEPMT